MARILIVDDDEIVAEIASDELTRGGHVVSSVHHGDEAIAAILQGAPDLVILDWVLPGKTGIEILRELRALPSRGDTPVMMLTSRRSRNDIIEAVNQGADDYVTKPFKLAELLPHAEALLAA